jgi:hypothetical protein
VGPEQGTRPLLDRRRQELEASLQIDEDTGVSDVAMDPSDEHPYAAAHQRRRRAMASRRRSQRALQSVDAGEHWKKLATGLPTGELGRIGISVYRKDPRVVYVSVEQGLRYNASTAHEQRKAGVYRSNDKGETWTFMSDWNPQDREPDPSIRVTTSASTRSATAIPRRREDICGAAAVAAATTAWCGSIRTTRSTS